MSDYSRALGTGLSPVFTTYLSCDLHMSLHLLCLVSSSIKWDQEYYLQCQVERMTQLVNICKAL